MRLLMQMRKKDRNSRKIFRRKNGIGEGERKNCAGGEFI